MTAPNRAGYFTGITAVATLGTVFVAAGCTPKIQVEAPKEPIVINMNVKIEHEIRVRVDKDLDDMFKDDALF
jgi:hypothetical protein